MIWALLITLLIKTLTGGPEEIFMIPNLEKEIKTSIEDKGRKKELLDIVKFAKGEIKSFDKIRKSKLKQIEKNGKLKDVLSEELYEIYKTYNDDRLNMQTELIRERLAIQDLLSEDEWERLIENAVFPSEKERKKIEKQIEKKDHWVDRVIGEIENVITQNVRGLQKRQYLIGSLNDFGKTLDEFIDEGQKMNFKDSELIRNRHATKEDLENFYKKQNELRAIGTKAYFKLRDEAIKNTNDQEWKVIVKALNKIVKK